MAPKNAGPNTNVRLIAVAAGAVVPIYATGPTRAWRMIESPGTGASQTAQTSYGFQVQIPNDGTVAGFTEWFTRPAVDAAVSPCEVYFDNWNHVSEHGPHGEVFGGPGNSTAGSGIGATAATLLCNVQSLTNNATVVEIVEYF